MKRSKKKLYFGHPLNTYDTELEARLLQIIAEAFPGWEIENPNQPHHQAECQRWKRMTGRCMDYFFQVVLPTCQGGVFLPFPNGTWGAGVFGEAQCLSEQGQKSLWQITAEGKISRVSLKKVKSLSIEETRSRLRIPFEESKAS